MRWVWVLLWTYLVFVLHTAVARELAIAGCAPHLLLAGLMLMVVQMNGREGVVVAALWGLLTDCLAGARLGPDVIAFALAACVCRQVDARWSRHAFWRTGALSVLSVWGALLVSTSLRMLGDHHTPRAAALAVHAAGPALYTGVLVAVVSLVIRMVLGRGAAEDVGAAPTVSNQWRRLTG